VSCQLHAPAALLLKKDLPVPIGYEAVAPRASMADMQSESELRYSWRSVSMYHQILFPFQMLLSGSCCPVSVGLPVWREAGSVLCKLEDMRGALVLSSITIPTITCPPLKRWVYDTNCGGGGNSMIGASVIVLFHKPNASLLCWEPHEGKVEAHFKINDYSWFSCRSPQPAPGRG
jgi:hypothetical protein